MSTENNQALPAPTPAVRDLEAGAPAASHTDSSRAARIGLWVLAVGFGGFLLWAGLAPLDEGVPTQGAVAIDTKRKTIQHLTGGIVKQVLVREGERVKEGQVLIKLDEAVVRANYEAVRQHYLGFRATQSRLLAEQAGESAIKFHPDLEAEKSDPLIRQQMFTQEQLFQSRRAGLRSDLQGIEESIQGQEGLLVAYESMLGNRKSQLALLNEELKNTRELVKEGYAPRNRQLELERMVAETSANIAEQMGNITRGRRSILELRQRAVSRQQDYRKEVEGQLADVTREVQSDAEKIVAVREDLGRVEIKAPVAGQIVGLTVQSIGGVIQPGQKIMDVVPGDVPLLLEARVSPHLIDKVHAGLPVDIRFSAFAHSPQLVVDGTVISVSGDLLTEQTATGAISYYLARIEVTPEGRQKLGKHVLQPGMPAEMVIKTGERSLLTYLLHPFTKRIAASMKEE